MKRYEKLAEEFSRQVRTGLLRPGDRLPSVRTVSTSHRVSTATVLQAFRLLEDRGEIHTRPRSGHYVSVRSGSPQEPAALAALGGPISVQVSDSFSELIRGLTLEKFLPLGAVYPAPELLPRDKLAYALRTASRRQHPQRIYDVMPAGNPELRRLIARRYLDTGCQVEARDILITAGAMEAINLCLRVVTRPGDVVAIGSPALPNKLLMLEQLRLKALEISVHPREGVDLAALVEGLERYPVKACLFMTSFHHPMGTGMPEEKKQALVALLAGRGIPMVENDVYADLYFGVERPKPAKAFDTSGLVLHCGSFSKSIAPGYRVGWAAPGRYFNEVEREKLTTSIATNVPSQAAIAEFIKHGGYNHHLRQLRRTLATNRDLMMQAIARHFPEGTKVSRPDGGVCLWVELPREVKALELSRLASKAGIAIAPGPIFSSRREYENCIRLFFALPWTPLIESAVASLGAICASLVPS
jgi:DNA-binding transcriptional MocR family regulator